MAEPAIRLVGVNKHFGTYHALRDIDLEVAEGEKLVVCGLKLAQGQLMAEQGQGKSTYLIDDLPSELDQEHSLLVCDLLASMDAQVFITCIDHQEVRSVWPEEKELAMFHVEQGTVKRHPGV